MSDSGYRKVASVNGGSIHLAAQALKIEDGGYDVLVTLNSRVMILSTVCNQEKGSKRTPHCGRIMERVIDNVQRSDGIRTGDSRSLPKHGLQDCATKPCLLLRARTLNAQVLSEFRSFFGALNAAHTASEAARNVKLAAIALQIAAISTTVRVAATLKPHCLLQLSWPRH